MGGGTSGALNERRNERRTDRQAVVEVPHTSTSAGEQSLSVAADSPGDPMRFPRQNRCEPPSENRQPAGICSLTMLDDTP